MSPVLTAADVRDARFSRPRVGRRGYRETDVDEFLDRVVATLEGRGDLTADDVREVLFRSPPWGKRGYDEDDVDNLLDNVVETLEALSRRRPRG